MLADSKLVLRILLQGGVGWLPAKGRLSHSKKSHCALVLSSFGPFRGVLFAGKSVKM